MTLHTVSWDAWQRRPELAIHMANISQIWNLIELRLAMIYIRLSGSNRQATGAMFLSIPSMRTRLKMLRMLADDGLDATLQEELAALCGRVEKLSRTRATIIHGLWSIHDDKPNSIFLTDVIPFPATRSGPIEYSAKTFRDREKRLGLLLVDLQSFGNRIWGIST